METKEIKIQIPEGYEIDKENSTFECIKFKLIKKNVTYKEVCEYLFKDKNSFYITNFGGVDNYLYVCSVMDKNNATNREQLKRLLALNQLLNIAEYYNRKSEITNRIRYKITYIEYTGQYDIHFHNVGDDIEYGISVIFNSQKDAQSVINNPNFREILDTIYKQ